MKNPKIIDTIFFYDELDMLVFRLTELDEHVDHFIIMESEIDFNGNTKSLFFKQNESLFEKWKNKITYLPSTNMKSEDFDKMFKTMVQTRTPITDLSREINRYNIQMYQLTILYHHLKSSNLYMEDLIMISDVDEIPDFLKMSEILDKVKFSPVIFRQKNFIWSTKFINTNPNFGTIFHQFTTLVTNPQLFLESYFYKTSARVSFEVIDSGYHLSHFYDIEKTKEKVNLINPSISNEGIQNCWNNLISIYNDKNNNAYGLVEYLGDLPKNIHLLKNQDIGRVIPKKHFVVINSNIETSEKYFEPFGETVSLINFTSDPKVSFKINLSEKITQYNILIPNSKYYDILIDENTLENFQKMYGINEIKSIIQSKLPLSMDLFMFFNGDNPGTLLGISWGELKDEFLYDKLQEIL